MYIYIYINICISILSGGEAYISSNTLNNTNILITHVDYGVVFYFDCYGICTVFGINIDFLNECNNLLRLFLSSARWYVKRRAKRSLVLRLVTLYPASCIRAATRSHPLVYGFSAAVNFISSKSIKLE